MHVGDRVERTSNRWLLRRFAAFEKKKTSWPEARWASLDQVWSDVTVRTSEGCWVDNPLACKRLALDGYRTEGYGRMAIQVLLPLRKCSSQEQRAASANTGPSSLNESSASTKAWFFRGIWYGTPCEGSPGEKNE